MSDYARKVEETLIRRAIEKGGECVIGMSECCAAARLTERGIGHWEQRHPFIATFVLHPQYKESE